MLIPDAGFLVELAVLVGLSLGTWALALWAVMRRPIEEVRATRLPRSAWIGLIVIFGPIAAVAYLLVVRLAVRARPPAS